MVSANLQPSKVIELAAAKAAIENYEPQILRETGSHIEAAPEVYQILRKVINDNDSLCFLVNKMIKIGFQKKRMKSKGLLIRSKTQVLPKIQQLIHPYETLIIIDRITWLGASSEVQEAILAEALFRLDEKEDGGLYMVNPDVQLMLGFAKRYGHLFDDVQSDKRRLLQLSLLDLPNT